jgi:hypothetical protein
MRPRCLHCAHLLIALGLLACLLALLAAAPQRYTQTAGPEQAPLVAALLAAQTVPGEADGPAFADVQTHADCFGVTRLVSAWRRGAS